VVSRAGNAARALQRLGNLACLLALLLGAHVARAQGSQERKVHAARSLVEELLLGPQRVVPQALIEDTKCLVAFPSVLEAAFGLGGSHGLGVASCRSGSGSWSPPVFLKISGGSIGLQVGIRSVDLMLFVVTDKGAQSLIRSSFALGGEVSVAAGPLDRKAGVSTDMRFEKDIYLYARARGLFAGASIEGTRLTTARKALERYYGQPLPAEQLLFDAAPPELPPEAQAFLDTLGSLPE
jgi:SH3 domain-containing YSC84-like protein 1